VPSARPAGGRPGPGRREPVGRHPGLARHPPISDSQPWSGHSLFPACRAGRHQQLPGGSWILMRLIEAWNRPAAGRPAQRDLARTVTRLSGTARPTAAIS